jgi:ABC-type Fe3+-hydroxamate transport system substrate-binding protein
MNSNTTADLNAILEIRPDVFFASAVSKAKPLEMQFKPGA